METTNVTNTLNSYQLNDVVVSVVDNPAGASRNQFKGRVGVVSGIEMIDGVQYYQIVFRHVTGFIFSADELRYATDKEIRNELITMYVPRKGC